jgi:hypothetical protein
MPRDDVSSVFPSRAKKVLNLESSSLMVDSEESTSGFQAVKILYAVADSSPATRSSCCLVVMASS